MEIISFIFIVIALGVIIKLFDLEKVKGCPPSDIPLNGFLEVKVEWIVDGDTVEVSNSNDEFKVRLYAIDCPEKDQNWGETAKAGLIKMIGGRESYVLLEIHGKDKYNRILATIYVEDESSIINVNERMVMLGHAWVMRRFYDQLPKNRKYKINRLERWAKSKRVGLWKSENPVPPWEWRKK